MLQAVIFDFDGTLADTLPLCIAAFRNAIEPATGRSLSDEEIVATFGPSEEGTIQALAPAHYDTCLRAYLTHYETLHDEYPHPFEGIVALLEALQSRNVRIGLVTGKGRQSTEISLNRLALAPYFEHIETGSPQGPRKVDGIRTMLTAWGLEPAQAVYVGDAPSDILASQEVGIPVVSVALTPLAEPKKLASLRPDALVHSVEELHTWLLGRL
ncbi:phosphoglycolate phosphatase/pyrophosphatase PpaX [Catalinimonas alkaloidigena]|uniref:Phosphoglycolate phosphatase/pyrophosphatase PpaX n=1 Tax=Catalinimonas alkaloidigena TaxID=1075417 RepID=A0A1G9SUQ7_9BACT|nr:HAD family hydrolase [Catalinimonas alkaloidigena]SDM39198.1 phosphoglycolate phosphatase/pyrophosphatase PpaX [Catalinimonas alkaloidigena]